MEYMPPECVGCGFNDPDLGCIHSRLEPWTCPLNDDNFGCKEEK